MQKYEEGLTDEELDNQIAKIEGELLPKEKPNPNLQNVIVDGYIFEIDRSVPKIVDYIGPANGTIITAYITGNDGWVKPGETVTVKGNIKKYGGGSVTSSSATATNGVTIPADFPKAGGSFTIPNISVDTDITITATDSDNETVSKKIEVKIKRDGTAPTVEAITAKAEGLIIKFTATGHDKNAEGQEESGIKHFNYEITSTQDKSLEGIQEKQRTGKFTQGQTVEIETTPTGDREETTYKILITAMDNHNNITIKENAKTADVITIDGLTLSTAKQLIKSASTLQKYMGKRIIDYNPKAGGKWRVFYYDIDGYFGTQGKLYLKRDLDSKLGAELNGNYEATIDGIKIMEQMNPMWKKSSNAEELDLPNERAVSWFYEQSQWSDYVIEGITELVMGSPSVELFAKSYCAWKSNSKILQTKIINNVGYTTGTNDIYGTADTDSNVGYEFGPRDVYGGTFWIASPFRASTAGALLSATDYAGMTAEGWKTIFCKVISSLECLCPVTVIS